MKNGWNNVKWQKVWCSRLCMSSDLKILSIPSRNLEFSSSSQAKGWIIDCRIKFDAGSEENENSQSCQSPAHLLCIVSGLSLNFPERSVASLLIPCHSHRNADKTFLQSSINGNVIFFLFSLEVFPFQIDSTDEKFNVKLSADLQTFHPGTWSLHFIKRRSGSKMKVFT